jgi:hypothetical protein
MATNTFSRENLVTAARMTHNNEIIDVAEVLNETNDVIADAHVQRANDITSHVISRRTSLPTPTWNKVGNGWNATTGLANQVREEIGMLKDRYQCPEDVMKLQPDKAKFRAQQERPHVEAIGQEFVNTLMGNWSAGTLTNAPPEEFAGFSARYPSLSSAADIASGAANASYVINNGNGTGTDNTSIWFVQWGPGKVYLITPRNSDGTGIKKEDKGLVLTAGDNVGTLQQNQLWAYITEFSWDVGLCIEDMRCVKRLANIDSVLGETNTLDEDNIIQIRNNFKYTTGTIYMYCNEQVYTQLQILAKDKSNVQWTEDNPFGKRMMYFLDMPIRRCDGITNAEGVLT